jgi:hypothetical protein
MTLTSSYQLVSSGACLVKPSSNFLFGFKSSSPTNVFPFVLTELNQFMNYDGSLGALYAKLASSTEPCELIVETE